MEIANSLCLGVRGVKQHVAELNRANGTVRQRNHARRRETVAAYLLVNVRGGGTGKLRAMNVRELNKYIASKPRWRGTGYHATRRDCIACGLGRQARAKKGVVRAARREMALRARKMSAARGAGVGKKRAWEAQTERDIKKIKKKIEIRVRNCKQQSSP